MCQQQRQHSLPLLSDSPGHVPLIISNKCGEAQLPAAFRAAPSSDLPRGMRGFLYDSRGPNPPPVHQRSPASHRPRGHMPNHPQSSRRGGAAARQTSRPGARDSAAAGPSRALDFTMSQ
eukprot:scaffold38532_cov29-Prasinocladus_malaysianus.AAC.5